MVSPLDAALRTDLAPTGTLRVALNLSNFLLVQSAPPGGEAVGIAPDVGRSIAAAAGLPVSFVPFPSPDCLTPPI